ncbi:MAG TPA: PIG-L deacetylase family protein [Tepidisphaeraceae bacterium]|jgi:LmbE family N-acetylglucosaminyl deacetylase
MTPIKAFASVKRVLCLGAHSDDVEIGAGGTVLRILAERPDVQITWVCFSSGGTPREQEARGSAADFTSGRGNVIIHGYRDAFFPSQQVQIKESFEALKKIDPDLILTHSRDDRHQDHRVINELTWNTFRSHQIMEYEIPKWDGDLQRPNAYVTIEKPLMDRKIELLLQHFGTQRSKHWFDDETFRSLARLRGLESNTRYAEAFVTRKLVI